MSTLKRIRFLSTLLLAGIFVGACTFPVTVSDDFSVEIGYVTNGAVIPLGEPVYVRGDATSTAGNISRLLFFANRSVFLEHENHYIDIRGDILNTIATWIPAEIGEVTLQVAAQRSSGYGYSEVITVCVLPFERADWFVTGSFSPETILIQYEGDCTIPERSSSVPGPLSMVVTANPDHISFVPLEVDGCTFPTSITFGARVSDPPDDVAIVTISLWTIPSAGPRNDQQTLILNRIGDELPNTKLYNMTYDAYGQFAVSLQHPDGITRSGELIWMARAFDRNGEMLLQQGPFTIPVNPVNCDFSPYAPLTAPSPSPSPVPTLDQSTPTPASALDCPPGTYYSDVTHKCYAYATPTTTPKSGGNEVNCSQFTSDSACKAAGCTYNYSIKSCQ